LQVRCELWPDVRLHIVSGKGGTGKTTVAAALALALATGGRRVLLVEVEGRQGIAQLFDIPPLPYEETRVAAAPEGGEVYAQAIDPERAMLEYLRMFYNIKRGGTALKKIGAIDFATTIAPGLRDVLITGKTGEAVRRRENAKFVWDAVVMDAPPTGRITRFLNVNNEVADLTRVGPIRNQADSIMRVIRSPETAVHLVTLLEEMPVQETIDGVAELQKAELPIGSIFVNMLQREELSDALLASGGDVAVDEIRGGLVDAGIKPTETLIKDLQAEARDHATRVGLQRRERERLTNIDVPLISLPQLPDGVDMAGLYELATAVREGAPQ
jgi:anion-transporting  ArsA/GET3 family ATPase